MEELRPQLVIDVGVWKGASAAFLARCMAEAGVVAVDTLLGSPEHWNRERADNIAASLRFRHGVPGLYWQLLAPGGALIGDDFAWKEVARAAQDFAAEVGQPLTVKDPKWILRKTGKKPGRRRPAGGLAWKHSREWERGPGECTPLAFEVIPSSLAACGCG